MIVVTTPMCRQIVEWAGLNEFKVNKHPDEEEGDLAILLSESKVNMDSLTIKINTFSQIKESIRKVSKCLFENNLVDEIISDESIEVIFNEYKNIDEEIRYGIMDEDKFNEIRENNQDKKVKVYSEFLKDIVSDIGATVIDFKYNKEEKIDNIGNIGNDNNKLDFDYIVYPDYLEEEVLKREKLESSDFKLIKIQTHNNISKDPILKAESRYSLLIEEIR